MKSIASPALAIAAALCLGPVISTAQNDPAPEESADRPDPERGPRPDTSNLPEIAKPKIEDLGDGRVRVGSVVVNKETKEISFDAELNYSEMPLEFALVAENGKIHEALLVTKARPFDINVALLLAGAKAGDDRIFDKFVPEENREALTGEEKAAMEKNRANKIGIRLDWEIEGEKKTARLEDWVFNRAEKTPMKHTAWIYNGSKIERGAFQAQYDGSIIALYLDPYSIANNPLEGNDDDERWLPANGLPPIGTKVAVTIETAAKAPEPSKEVGAKDEAK
ncbi:MAG: YdjY domain-containing protein [Verrucomicrobiales bacterium]